jgi:transposase
LALRVFVHQNDDLAIYLPPYSPDFNPIEMCWAKIKEGLRAAKARLVDALDQAVAAAISTITPQNSTAWFQHCGYRIQQP